MSPSQVAQKRVVLLVAHGSRLPEANALATKVASQLQGRLSSWAVQVAYLELVPPDVATSIDRCVAEGAEEIVVQPLLLAEGRHSSEDIPLALEAAMRRHTSVTFRLGDVLGNHELLLELLSQLVESAAPAPRR